MEFIQYFDYESGPIPVDKVHNLSESVLDNLYSSKTEIEQVNVYFHLENELYYLLNKGFLKEAAYICYLLSYYLYTPLTPPHSADLSLVYAKKAIEMDSKEKYFEWLKYLESDIKNV